MAGSDLAPTSEASAVSDFDHNLMANFIRDGAKTDRIRGRFCHANAEFRLH